MSKDPSGGKRRTLLERAAAAFADLLIRRPLPVAALVLVLAVVSAVSAQKWLRVNPNQLDLISQELRQVKDVKRVVDMIGGTGHIILALRSDNEELMKKVSDDVAVMLNDDKEHVRNVSYKIKTDFVRERAALFMETEDLKEVRRRIMEKLRDAAKRASPFYFEITPTPPVELKVEDIIQKYTRIGKKSIVDEYFISEDRKMLILTVKPMWPTNEVEKTGKFRELLQAKFAEYSKNNPHGATFVEDYSFEPAADKQTVEYGFTGSYISSHDDEALIIESLGPVSTAAGIGVLFVMLAFFRRRIGSVGFVMTGLVAGIAISFGFALASVGELNMITSILAGILMGNGIDFGIFLIFRLREELGRHDDPADAVRTAIINAGPASFVSAAGIGIAFLSLMLSEFRGFSQFGLLAGAGVFLIGLTLYAWIPATLLALEKRFPGSMRKIVGSGLSEDGTTKTGGRINRPWLVVGVTVAVALPIAVFAPKVIFDYDSRALVVENQPSIVLQDELNVRMQIAADPVAVATDDYEQAKAVWDHFNPLPEGTTVDQVVSIYSFLPPMERQEANAKVLAEWKEELSEIDRNLLPEDLASRWDEAVSYLEAKPYTREEIPPLYADMFTHIAGAKPENHGVLTFIYPKIDTWDGKQLLTFADEVEEIKTPSGTYNSAGSSILFATLARMVLKDSRTFIFLTMALLLVILLLDTRSIRSAALALLPLVFGVAITLGILAITDQHLNFMNIVVFPIVLGYAVSQGVYFIHRFNEGTSPRDALRSVGTAVACSTITTLAGWSALLIAAHKGLKTMGVLAVVGMGVTLVVSFILMPAVLQIIVDRREAREGRGPQAEEKKVA